MNAGVSLPMLGSANAELAKALSIPVPGAVVIAPLTQSWKNYGSAGGEFITYGSPTVSAVGATFSGSNAALIQTDGEDITTVACVTVAVGIANQAFPYTTLAGRYGDASGVFGWGFRTALPSWECVASGVQAVADGPITYAKQVFTVRRQSGSVTFFISGSLVGTLSAGALGNTLCLGGRIYLGVLQAMVKCSICSVAHFNNALSPTDQALVEAWAAA